MSTPNSQLISASPHTRDPHAAAIAAALAAPFDPKDIKFKPQTIKNNRALAMAYVDARLIQDRLDRVLGVENWQDSYQILPDGSVMCRLRVKLGDRWIAKADVGSPSSQPDSGDRLKAAFSDALKRAAVKFGIGRYLYRLPAQWVDYDPVKKQLIRPPALPSFAVPTPTPSASPDAKPEPATDPARGISGPMRAKPRESLRQDATSPSTKEVRIASTEAQRSAVANHLPANGEELQRRLEEYDAKLASQNLCARGELVEHVTKAGVRAGFASKLSEWSGVAIPFAVAAVKAFEQTVRTTANAEHGAAA